MHPADCPVWEYSNHPDKDRVLRARTIEIVKGLRTLLIDSGRTASDSRNVHQVLFSQLTPPKYDYYAGHYRGESYRCLLHYTVQIPSDPRVGFAPYRVLWEMGNLASEVKAGVNALDIAHSLPKSQLPLEDRLLHTVAFACHVFELFLRIHPYANGNGHGARVIVWSILGRYGYWPRGWSIEPRPPDPPYSALLVEHRNGNPDRLEQYMISQIV